LPIEPRSSITPGRLKRIAALGGALHSTQRQPTHSRASASSAGSGSDPLPRVIPHALRSGATVMSNAPCVAAESSSAERMTSTTSALTGTGRSAAARFTAAIWLSGR
jgi:hypothetical protein